MIEYTPTQDDQAALTALLWHRSGRDDVIQFGFWLAGVVVGAGIGILAAMVSVAVGGRPAPAIGALAGPALVFAWTVLYVFVPDVRAFIVHWYARRQSTRTFTRRGAARIWLDQEGLHTEGGGKHSIMNAKAVREVVETPEYVFPLRLLEQGRRRTETGGRA